mgnify:CR=1 FL=1
MVKTPRRRDRLQRIMLVPVSPLRQLSTRAAWAAALVLCAGLAFLSGRWSVSQAASDATQQVDQITQSSQSQLRSLEERTDIRLKECGIIQAASERLQEDNQELLASLALLEDRMAFFKRLATPQAASNPLSIEQFELLPAKLPGHVRYRLLVTRGGAGATTSASVAVTASAGGRAIKLVMPAPRFQFRYYQQFSGEWALPAGFQPERVDIQVSSAGGSITRRYKWEIQAR